MNDNGDTGLPYDQSQCWPSAYSDPRVANAIAEVGQALDKAGLRFHPCVKIDVAEAAIRTAVVRPRISDRKAGAPHRKPVR